MMITMRKGRKEKRTGSPKSCAPHAPPFNPHSSSPSSRWRPRVYGAVHVGGGGGVGGGWEWDGEDEGG